LVNSLWLKGLNGRVIVFGIGKRAGVCLEMDIKNGCISFLGRHSLFLYFSFMLIYMRKYLQENMTFWLCVKMQVYIVNLKEVNGSRPWLNCHHYIFFKDTQMTQAKECAFKQRESRGDTFHF